MLKKSVLLSLSAVILLASVIFAGGAAAQSGIVIPPVIPTFNPPVIPTIVPPVIPTFNPPVIPTIVPPVIPAGIPQGHTLPASVRTAPAAEAEKTSVSELVASARTDMLEIPEPAAGEELYIGVSEIPEGKNIYLAFLYDPDMESIRYTSVRVNGVLVENSKGTSAEVGWGFTSNPEKWTEVDPSGASSVRIGNRGSYSLTFGNDGTASAEVTLTITHRVDEGGEIPLEPVTITLFNASGQPSAKEIPEPVSYDEAVEMGLGIPDVPDGEILYLGAGDSVQAEKILAAFTIEPGVPELHNLIMLIYHADAENDTLKLSDLTAQIRTDGSYPGTGEDIEEDSFSLRNLRFTDNGAEADLAVTLHLPVMNSTSDFVFDEVPVVFRVQGGIGGFPAVPEAAASEAAVEEAEINEAEIEEIAAEDIPEEETAPVQGFAMTPESILLNTLLQQLNNNELSWTSGQFGWGEKLAIGIFGMDGVQKENSFSAARSGDDFYGIPAERLAKTINSTNTVLLVIDEAPFLNYCMTASIAWPSKEILQMGFSDADYVPPEGSEIDPSHYYLMMLADIPDSWLNRESGEDDYQSETDYPEEAAAEPAEEPADSGDEDLYNEAKAYYREEKYYSARQAFLKSGYGDWEEMAEKCIQRWPSTGELWHDRTQWLQDMELTISVEQPKGTGMYLRVFKNGEPISNLFIYGPGSVTALLPGNAYYSIKNGVGNTWYGEKEAFGREGSYETMTFDENGSERTYLQSNYAYTLSINVSSSDPDADSVYSEDVDWETFIGN